jgi:hypothetical protein
MLTWTSGPICAEVGMGCTQIIRNDWVLSSFSRRDEFRDSRMSRGGLALKTTLVSTVTTQIPHVI